MQSFLNSPLTIGSLRLEHRLIQGPLAGFSCAPFRELFSTYTPPAYCVSEMISAHDLLYKHKLHSRYLFRSPEEKLLCYQIAGNDVTTMAQASAHLEGIGADLIDINCGCPKTKIRKKGAGSALLEEPQRLIDIITAVRQNITIPLTVKIRIQGNAADIDLVKRIEEAGANAIIVHGRHWSVDYEQPCNLQQIASIKQAITIPVIANGDIFDKQTLSQAINISGCDGYMISRAGTGKPWLYESLLSGNEIFLDNNQLKFLFMNHLMGLAKLEDDFKAMLQSKSLFRYYFKNRINTQQLQEFYALRNLNDIENHVTALDLIPRIS
ncbi:tRNA-dihydrouridine synthase family protein [Legionella cardiaca]|uniref:tRNA-dihydrouridine synthase n=1 Tax=Legionella cardiaca TaxID=1071983 RepID=A0ABY8ARB0_9GAMM|nr:tRNA-dihydrouridine synthase family protein [Legionella cardiaca]WED42761.1 tRNA-dihydrouridine synthase family protein [Legionella cardiaca]